MHTFCVNALDQQVSATEKRRLLRNASVAHANTMMRVARGRGCIMHLEALDAISRNENKRPAIFQSKAWQMVDVNGPRGLSIDSSEGLLAQESGYVAGDLKSPLLHYEVEENECLFWVQGPEVVVGELCEALKKAAEIVRGLLED
jgi:hypothetical protein